MAVKPFSNEELNYFKFSSVVLDEFPRVLRQTFVTMWDTKIAVLPGFLAWDDSVTVRNMLLTCEGGKTDIPINKSINDWDCTALFKATIFAQTFSVLSSKGPKKTLAEVYLKGRKPKPNPYHTTVISPTADHDETITLAVDQLRLLRNTLCHLAELRINKSDFSQYVQLTKDAFTALHSSTASVEAIGGLSDSDFPTTKVSELNESIKRELQASNLFLQEVVHKITETTPMILDELSKISCELTRKNEQEMEQLDGTERAHGSDTPNLLRKCCLPPMVPHFTGRAEVCKKIIEFITSESTRLVGIWGSPGFGKTSTVIAVGHDLESLGHSVYFFSFRGITTKHEFISKILSFFKRSSKLVVSSCITPEDELCSIFEEIDSRFFVILDNLDDLFGCDTPNTEKAMSVKENVLHLIYEFFVRCKDVRFLITTRVSTQFIGLKIVGSEFVRIGPLDQISSECLVSELLLSAAKDISTQIAGICGNVPLAMKLLCSLIRRDDLMPSESLNDIVQCSDSILEITDNPSHSNDLRLKLLLESSFKTLSLNEREAFVSLSVFLGIDFDVSAAISVIGGKKLLAKQMLMHLEKKSLLDFRASSKTYSLHPLIQSFAFEKGQSELKEVANSSKTRLNEYYLLLFEKLNDEFLAGNALTAFQKFYQDEINIWSSFNEGMHKERLCYKLFDILAKAELFLDALHPHDRMKVESLYDLAPTRAKEQGRNAAYFSLLVSKCLSKITGYTGTNGLLVAENRETEEKILSLSGTTAGKYLIYKGIYAVNNGMAIYGVEMLDKGLRYLINTAEHRILRAMALQILVFYYNYHSTKSPGKLAQYSEMILVECNKSDNLFISLSKPVETVIKKNDKVRSYDSTLQNHPLVLWVISLLVQWTREFLHTDAKKTLSIVVHEIQRQVEENSSFFDKTLSSVLEIRDWALVFLSHDDGAQQMQKTAKEIELALKSEKSAAQQTGVLDGKSKKTSREMLLLERLAKCYHLLASHHYNRKEYASQIHFSEEELRVRIELQGEQHPKVAKMCHAFIGTAHALMKDNTSALQSYCHALGIQRHLYGELHGDTAKTYIGIGRVQNNMKDYALALQSFQCALDIQRKIYGKQHAETAQTYYRIGRIQYNMRDCISALQSFQRCLDIQRKLYGEQHPDTAKSYHEIGVVQEEMEECKAALQSFQRALDIRLKLYGEQHACTAQSYYNIGVALYRIYDFTSAINFFQRSLEVNLTLHGQQDEETERCYKAIDLCCAKSKSTKRLFKIRSCSIQ